MQECHQEVVDSIGRALESEKKGRGSLDLCCHL